MRRERSSATCPEHSGLAAEIAGLGDRLERIEDKLDVLAGERLPVISAEIAALKTRAGLWGLLAGVVGAALAQVGVGHWSIGGRS